MGALRCQLLEGAADLFARANDKQRVSSEDAKGLGESRCAHHAARFRKQSGHALSRP